MNLSNYGWQAGKCQQSSSHIRAVFQYCISKNAGLENSKYWIYQQQHNYGWQAGTMQCIYVNRVPFEQINMGCLRK